MNTIWFPDSHYSSILNPGLHFFSSSVLALGFVFHCVVCNKTLCHSVGDLQYFEKLTICLLNMTMSIASVKLIQVSGRLVRRPLNFSPPRGQYGQGGGREELRWVARVTTALATATLYSGFEVELTFFSARSPCWAPVRFQGQSATYRNTTAEERSAEMCKTGGGRVRW